MGDFTPINTQEELDAILAERLRRKDEQTAKKYGDYDDLKTKVTTYETQIGDLNEKLEELTGKQKGHEKEVSELTAKVKKYETAALKSRIASEKGLPLELADRLTGETEEELGKDAEKLLGVVGKTKKAAPLADPEPGKTTTDDSMWRSLAKNLNGKE